MTYNRGMVNVLVYVSTIANVDSDGEESSHLKQ